MRIFLKLSALLLLLFACITVCGYFFWYKPKFNHHISETAFKKKPVVSDAVYARLKQKARLAEAFNEMNDYDTGYCFLVDMKIASGRKRFFVYNLQKDSVEAEGLVTHGSGSDKGSGDLYFSNIANSNCTSLGKYRIGKSYNGKFGPAYKLYGLEKTNSNAFNRFVVLHAHSCVPESETDPFPICKSWGCPTVSPAFLKLLKKYIEEADKPVLLWIYY